MQGPGWRNLWRSWRVPLAIAAVVAAAASTLVPQTWIARGVVPLVPRRDPATPLLYCDLSMEPAGSAAWLQSQTLAEVAAWSAFGRASVEGELRVTVPSREHIVLTFRTSSPRIADAYLASLMRAFHRSNVRAAGAGAFWTYPGWAVPARREDAGRWWMVVGAAAGFVLAAEHCRRLLVRWSRFRPHPSRRGFEVVLR